MRRRLSTLSSDLLSKPTLSMPASDGPIINRPGLNSLAWPLYPPPVARHARIIDRLLKISRYEVLQNNLWQEITGGSEFLLESAVLIISHVG